MELFRVYVATKKKSGTVTKSDSILVKAVDKIEAIQKATKEAKELYGFKGKVHIGSVFIKNSLNPIKYEKI